LVSAGLKGFESVFTDVGSPKKDTLSFSLIKISFWFNMTLSRLFEVIRRVPNLAATESAAERLEQSCFAFARVTFGRSVDFDLPWVFKSAITFGRSF